MINIFKSLLFLAIFSFSAYTLSAQEVIPATGGDGSGSGGSVSYTVGQIGYTTIESENGTITQGVQQPFEIFVIVGIEEAEDIVLFCTAFPNPTTGNLTLRIENYDNNNLSYQLFDFNGRLIENKEIEGAEAYINMNSIAAATYFLKVLDGNKEIKTFKILKK